MINYIIHKIQQLINKNARIYFSFLSKINKLSVNSVSSRTPFIFIYECALVHHKIHVLAAQFIELGANGLKESRNRNRFVNGHRNIANAKLNGIEEWMYAKVP